ncbi:MAG: ATP-binding protein [Bacteroidales bacterium]|jgi:AAA+ ATPase superfamily predicted ATPase|nr:ATP-binding protein [Bacteroidales bacterium]
MKHTENLNPFFLTGYKNPEYFCDREKETKKMVEALVNGRNLTLISPRRMGKTGLIHHVFHLLKEKQDAFCIYFDIYHTQTLHDFVQIFAGTVIGSLDTKSQKLMTKIFSLFKSLRLVLTTDNLSGTPELTFDISPEKTESSLEEIFDYLANTGKTCYIAIDEFQQITNYPEKGVEALLRSYIQRMTNVHFIFSGSQKHIMENLFVSASRPFYQSTQLLQLKEIDENEYVSFAQRLFKKGNKTLTSEACERAYQVVGGHTWYVQMLFNRLYSSSNQLVTIADMEKVLDDILEENEATFSTYCKLITDKQKNLLKAIAIDGTVSEPTASDFIGRHNLGASSTVSVSLKNLLNKELLFENRGSYFIYDRFFSLWLRKISV